MLQKKIVLNEKWREDYAIITTSGSGDHFLFIFSEDLEFTFYS